MKTIGLDVGRHRVKIYTDDSKRLSFASYSGEYRDLKLEREMGTEDRIVEFRGNKYYVGPIAQDESWDGVQSFLISKVNFDTLLLGLTAINGIVESGDEIRLVVGHPVSNHHDKEKERMRKLFIGRHNITVNGRYRMFDISDVIVTSECAATTYLLPEKHEIAHGIDAGGATTNFVTWKRGMWIDRLSGTLPHGLDNTNMSMERFARLVSIEVSKAIHIFQGPIYTMGGASNELAYALKGYVHDQQIIPLNEGLFANAKAYYQIGQMVNNKLQTQR